MRQTRCGWICYFLVPAQESNQRKRHREGAELIAPAIKAALPYIPIPARIAMAAEHLNGGASTAKMFRFLLRCVMLRGTAERKSEHFRVILLKPTVYRFRRGGT